jgi:hypothetical protein
MKAVWLSRFDTGQAMHSGRCNEVDSLPVGRALVALAPAVDARTPLAVYRQAPFLAQLIATKEQHAQTRERRRAEIGEAVAAYRAAALIASS